eukprot:4895889-Prymnesium_polylepis.1
MQTVESKTQARLSLPGDRCIAPPSSSRGSQTCWSSISATTLWECAPQPTAHLTHGPPKLCHAKAALRPDSRTKPLPTRVGLNLPPQSDPNAAQDAIDHAPIVRSCMVSTVRRARCDGAGIAPLADGPGVS